MLPIGPQYYSHIYIGLVVLLSLIVFKRYTRYSSKRLTAGANQTSIWVLVLAISLSLFVGLRPVSEMYFVDMANYSAALSFFNEEIFTFDWSTDNILFDNFLLFCAARSFPEEVFFISISVIYFCCMAWACASLFPRDKMAAFLVCLGAFSTFSYATNGIKAGAAASLFLVALAMYKNRKILWAFLFVLLSIGFHHSMVVPAAAFMICLFVKDLNSYY